MSQPLRRKHQPVRIARNSRGIVNEQHKPNIRGFKVYVGDFVAPDDPANDPDGTSPSSPSWRNGFTFVVGFEVWFAHGLDGELDMGGMYDLVTGAPVSGDVAFYMPFEWAITAPFAHHFPIELDTDVWSMAIQKIDINDPDVGGGLPDDPGVPVRIYWPIVADPAP